MRISGWTCIEDNRKNPKNEEILIMWEYKNNDSIIIYTPDDDYLIEYEDSKSFEVTKSIRVKSLRKSLDIARNWMHEVSKEKDMFYKKIFQPVSIIFTEKELIQSFKIAKRKKYKTISEQAEILVERYLRLNKLNKSDVDVDNLHKKIKEILNHTNYGIT